MSHDPNLPLYKGDAITIDGDEFVVVDEARRHYSNDKWLVCFIHDGEFHMEEKHIDWFTDKLHRCSEFSINREKYCSMPQLEVELPNLFYCQGCGNARVTSGVDDLAEFISRH